MVVPNKQKTYDLLRNVTPTSWFVERYENIRWDFDLDEIRSMVTMTKGLPQYEVSVDALDALCHDIKNSPDGTHHYSVYDPRSMIEFGDLAANLFNLEIVNFQVIRHEMHLVMCKK